MTPREKPPRSWNVDMLFVLGKREGIKANHLKAVPVLILERWVEGKREEGVANYIWTKDIAKRLVDSGLVSPFKPKGTSVVLASLTTIQGSRNLTRPPLIEYRGEGMFWVNLPHYELLLQEYRSKYRELYPEDYEKLFAEEEPEWGMSSLLEVGVKPRAVGPVREESKDQDNIKKLIAPLEQALRDQQQAVERLIKENQKLQVDLQAALYSAKEAKTKAKDAETKITQLEKQFAKNKSEYIHSSRVIQLRAISSQQYDLTRLIELCEELNDNYTKGNVLAVPMLVRAIIDHVPPILGYNTFNEITNNYGGVQTSKSFKKCMQNLQNSLRNIADASIHTTIRSKETLPNNTQIDFSPDLDVLLEEIVRILK